MFLMVVTSLQKTNDLNHTNSGQCSQTPLGNVPLFLNVFIWFSGFLKEFPLIHLKANAPAQQDRGGAARHAQQQQGVTSIRGTSTSYSNVLTLRFRYKERSRFLLFQL